MRKIKALILKNEDPYDHEPWVKACENFNKQVEYKVINITSNDWLYLIIEYNPDICLLKPSGKTSLFRKLYQERVDIIANDLNIKIFPSFQELRIYENKRFFAYWAQANDIPHANTYIFYNKKEAFEFSKKFEFPIVGKLNIGAAGNGISILHNKKELNQYITKGFSDGLKARTGPKLEKGNIIKRAWEKFIQPKKLINRLKTYSAIASDTQKGFVIIQEYIPHDYEWRVVRIGDSFFAHKKLKINEKASGTLLKKYDNPPLSIFDFVKDLTDRFGFYSVAVDLFEKDKAKYLVNEIQCIFGQSDPYQMLVDGKQGRYIYKNEQWIFEEGKFNTNQSYDLRLKYVISKLENIGK